MANFNREFGSDTPVKKTEGSDKTPNQQKEELKTGRPAGAPVGDTAGVRSGDRNEEVWAYGEDKVVEGGILGDLK